MPIFGKTYGWNDGTSSWISSNRETITWQSTTANDDNTIPAIQNLWLSAYPNPFSSNLNVQVNSKLTAPVSVQLFNLKGQLVYADKTEPNHSITINKTLSNGIYFLKARQGNDTCARKIIHIK